MIFLTKTLSEYLTTSKEEASMIVARELRDDWIGKMCIPHMKTRWPDGYCGTMNYFMTSEDQRIGETDQNPRNGTIKLKISTGR